MATELIYTSAPAGLKPGTYGFCVVACTRGLKESYATALQSLSGYRRLFSPESGRERQNPVVYANYVVEIGGVPTRVLSRVGDAGYDYSNRTNKIAHHLILSNSELASAGPAALFAVPNLFVERWNSKPTYIEQEKKIPTPTEAPLRGSYWKELTGDSEWARALAATVSTDRSVLLIVRPDCDVLRLYREALELLPPRQRWNATFSTYFTSVPPGVRCQWKAVITGSPEEEQLRARRDTLVVDLTDPRKTGELAKFVANLPNWRLEKQATPQPERNAVQIETRVSAPRPTDPATPQVSDRPKVYSLRAEDVLTTGVPIKPKPIRKKLNYGRDAVLTTDVPVKKNNNVVAILASVGILSLLLVVFGAVFLFTYTHSKDAKPQSEPQAQKASGDEQENKPMELAVGDNDGNNDDDLEKSKESADPKTETFDSKEETLAVDDARNENNGGVSEESKESADPKTETCDSKEETLAVDDARNENNGGVSKKSEETSHKTEDVDPPAVEESKSDSATEGDDFEKKIIAESSKNLSSEDSSVIRKISLSQENSKSGADIEERIEGEYQKSLKDLVAICRNNQKTLKLWVHLSKLSYYSRDGGRTAKEQSYEFNSTEKVEFISDNKSQKEISFTIDENGVLSLTFSDQEIRKYFLLYGQIRWEANLDVGHMQSRYNGLLEAKESYFPSFKQDDKTVSFDIDLEETYEKIENPKPEWKFPNQIRTKEDSKVYLIVELESKQQEDLKKEIEKLKSKQQEDLEEKIEELESKQQKVLKEKNGKYQYTINDSKFDISLKEDKEKGDKEDKGICVIKFTLSDKSSRKGDEQQRAEKLNQIKDSIADDLTIKVYLGDKDGRTLLKVIKGKQPDKDKKPEEPGDKSNSSQDSQTNVK